MPAPHPAEFRQRAVELARTGTKPVRELARDLGISESCLRNWLAQADADDGGSADRMTSAEKKELAESIITLSAICMFYVYLRHRSDLTAFLIVAALVIPVAIFSNFVRVLVLVLITYYLGEAAGQGFLHDFAGLLLFLVSLVSIFGLDALFTRLRHRRAVTA